MAGVEPLYITRMSVSFGAEFIHSERWCGQKNLFAETALHYLLLDEKRHFGPDSLKYVVIPPLRAREHQETLWKAVREGFAKIPDGVTCIAGCLT